MTGSELVFGAFGGGLLLSFLAGVAHEFVLPRLFASERG